MNNYKNEIAEKISKIILNALLKETKVKNNNVKKIQFQKISL